MRVSPVGLAYDDMNIVLEEAKKTAEVTHIHPEGVKGAQATAAALLLARVGRSKDEIKRFIEGNFGYNLSATVVQLRERYTFDVSCQITGPRSIVAFLVSDNYEDAIRKAISCAGDSDPVACIAGGIAEAFYGGVPPFIEAKVLSILDDKLRTVMLEFRSRFPKKPIDVRGR